MYTIKGNIVIRDGDGLVCFRGTPKLVQEKCDKLNKLTKKIKHKAIIKL